MSIYEFYVTLNSDVAARLVRARALIIIRSAVGIWTNTTYRLLVRIFGTLPVIVFRFAVRIWTVWIWTDRSTHGECDKS